MYISYSFILVNSCTIHYGPPSEFVLLHCAAAYTMPFYPWTHQMCFENFVFVLWGDFWLWLKLLVVWRQSTCHVILTQQFWFFDFCGGRRGHVMILRDWNLFKKKQILTYLKKIKESVSRRACISIHLFAYLDVFLIPIFWFIISLSLWLEANYPIPSQKFSQTLFIFLYLYFFFFKQMKWNQIKWETIWNTGCNFSQRPVTDVVVVYSIPHSQRTDTCGQCSAAISWWRRYNKEREMELTAGI